MRQLLLTFRLDPKLCHYCRKPTGELHFALDAAGNMRGECADCRRGAAEEKQRKKAAKVERERVAAKTRAERESLPYVVGSETSREAAESMVEFAGSVRDEVLRFIRVQGIFGATCDELEMKLDLKHQTASARLAELAQEKAITQSSAVRPTRSGRNAAVWIATDHDPTDLPF